MFSILAQAADPAPIKEEMDNWTFQIYAWYILLFT